MRLPKQRAPPAFHRRPSSVPLDERSRTATLSPVRVNVRTRRFTGGAVDSVTMMTADDPALRTVRSSDGIELRGELDAHNAELLREALSPVPETGDFRVDVSGVTFIDSSGLRILLELHQSLARDGRRLVLLTPSRPVARLVQIAGLTSHLHIEPPLDPDGRLSSPRTPAADPEA
jgi:anti-sigma B factor antagonist